MSYIERFKQYPLIMQWLLILAVVAILFMVWQWVIWNATVSLNDRAAKYEAAIERANNSDNELAILSHADAIVALGETEPLNNEVEGVQRLSETIANVLNENNVLSRDVDIKQGEKFKNREKAKLLNNRDGEKAIAEVRFEASQKDAFAIITQLESDPAIETISMVRMSRSVDPRKKTLNVQLSVEAWVIPGLQSPRTRPANQSRDADVDVTEESSEGEGSNSNNNSQSPDGSPDADIAGDTGNVDRARQFEQGSASS